MFAIASLIVAGCASVEAGAPEETESDVAPIVRPNVRVIDGEPGVDFELRGEEIVAERARHLELARSVAGDVLVSGRVAGLLRRVRSVRDEGAHLVIGTEAATLEDVFEQVHVRGPIGAGSTPTRSPGGGPVGGGVRPQLKVVLPLLSLNNQRLSVGQSGEIEIVDGSFSLEPELDFDLTMRDGKVEFLKLLASGQSQGHLHVRYDIKRSPVAQPGVYVRVGDGGILLAESPPAHSVFWAGYVPIVVSVRLRLLGGIALNVGGDASGEQDVRAEGVVSAGVEYRSGSWRDLSAKTVSLEHSSVTMIASRAIAGDVTLTAQLDVAFYELAGPYLALQAYVGLGAQDGEPQSDRWYSERGMRGIAGVDAAVFGKSLGGGYRSILFDLRETEPIPSLVAAPPRAQ